MADSGLANTPESESTQATPISKKDDVACKLFGYPNSDAQSYIAMKNSAIEICLKYLPKKELYQRCSSLSKGEIWTGIIHTWRKDYAEQIKILQVNLSKHYGHRVKHTDTRDYIVGMFGEWNSQAGDNRRAHPRRDLSKITSTIQFLSDFKNVPDPEHPTSPQSDIDTTTTTSAFGVQPLLPDPVRLETDSMPPSVSPPIVNWSLSLVRFILYENEKKFDTRIPLIALCNPGPQDSTQISPYMIQWSAIEKYLDQTVLREHLPLTNLYIHFEGSKQEPRPLRDIGELYTQFLLWSQSSFAKPGVNIISFELYKSLQRVQARGGSDRTPVDEWLQSRPRKRPHLDRVPSLANVEDVSHPDV